MSLSDRGQLDPGDNGSGGGTLLDAYLDGQLTGAELAVFEARLASEPALAARRDAQRRIDRGLRGLFVVPPFIALPINGHPPTTPGHPANGHPVSPGPGA